ncbi:hypothetical protein BGZ70_002835 [Mortierella alpina]|uniref:Uncharacterized protein n=1 Tax=Mortierella alpina TaxID=64518 RepID=A0A9P6ITV8_MORAP|nr:hypothetical protein BGZ70_002835 [Mortierella alpina]
MLSPIQSYFGSDPNSPASSFSLPRHDHYPRLSVDQSLDSSDASPMDGYHGFATHIWSEQSTTPAHALSHRWTRRMSQPDAYPSRNRSVHNLAQENLRASVLRSSSTALPRAFAPAAMDQPWSEGASSISVDREFSTASDDIYDVDHDLVSGEDVTQDSADEGTMDDSYGDYESTYDHNYDHNHNLRNWDEDDEIHDDETYPYGYQVPSVGAQADVDMNGGEDEDLDSDQHLDEIIDSSRQAPSRGGLLIHNEMDDMSEEESEMVHILGFDRQQSTSMAMLYGHTPTATPSSPDSASSQQASSDDTNRSNASDEALARRLQEEEYARLMGERRSMSSTLLSSNSLFRPSPDSPRWPSDYRSALGLTYSTAYPDRSRPQSATRSNSNARTEEDRRRRVFRAMASSSSSGRRPSNGGGGGGGDLGRVRGRPSGARSAFIEAHSASARLSNRTARGRRSRSPPSHQQQQQQQHPLLLHHQDLPSSLTRTLQNTTRILDLLNRFTQRLESGVMDRMWGNPEDYMHDDQVDDSYEGLLRLSERIGLAKPKGVAEQTLRAMDRHISSWGRIRGVKAALRSSATPASSAEESLDEK